MEVPASRDETRGPDVDPCSEPEGGHARAGVPAPDLHCIPLFSTPAAPSAGGRVVLHPASSPFGAAVDREGRHRWRLELEAEGLPHPSTLGDFDRYVAWLTPVTLAPVVPLGHVANGIQDVGEAAFNTFLVLVSAEGAELGDSWKGPLVLRGSSPGMVLRPHDVAFLLGEMSAPPQEHEEDHGAHRDHPHPPAAPPHRHELDHPLPGEVGEGVVQVHLGHHFSPADLPRMADVPWRPPPMHPEIDMPGAMMRLRPGIGAFNPALVPAAKITGPEPGWAAPSPGSEGLRSDRPPLARPREEVRLAHGDSLILEAGPVVRRIGSVELPGYGFNGQIPGPLIRAPQGATIHILFRNRTALPSAVHWHGIRLENRFDGVPGVTQDPVPSGADFPYRIRLPDEGTYWYHPHLREDVTQDLGLSGNLHVSAPGEGNPYGPVHREEFLILDDHLIGPEGPVPYGREAPSHALMGRFGNVLLLNNRTDWTTSVEPGTVARFHLTNAANTRTFNLSFGDLPMKLVAGDVGKLPVEVWVESVVIAPAERWVVEVHFPVSGRVPLMNRVQAVDHMGGRFFAESDTVGVVRVEGPEPGPDPRRDDFLTLREAPDVKAEVNRLMEAHLGREPERTLLLELRSRDLPFPLDPLLSWEGVFRAPVDWTGTMPEMDWLVSGVQAEWILRDPATESENMEIDWRFRVGDQVRLRLVNDRDALHPMQHPVHIHGQRFLVLAVNGQENPHPTWKDTVLVPIGTVVDVLVEMSNPGDWMIHCHIAEHLETGMMAVFRVEP
jgi:suppressor of ftsI